MHRENVQAFDANWKAYDQWYEEHQAIFQSEISALKRVTPTSGLGLELGVGTGRVASALSVRYGLDLSLNMLKQARKRSIQVIQGLREALPFKNESFHFALIVVTICFVDNPLEVIKEAFRTLKKKGILILGIIDRESRWGRFYEAKASQSKYYKAAYFFSGKEILNFIQRTSGEYRESYQTLYQSPPDIQKTEDPRKGYGKGGFVVSKSKKK